MPDPVRIEISEAGVQEVMYSDDVRDMLMDAARPVVARAKASAPRRTGAGADSIRAEPVFDGFEWTVRVSWTRDSYYLYFHDQGTRYQRAQGFLEGALEAEA
jgi:HK97 gp10 family phage protein